MTHSNSPLQQQLLDIPVAEWDRVVQLDSVADDFGCKAVTIIHEPEARQPVQSISKRSHLCHPCLT
jgi:hypothetical protein